MRASRILLVRFALAASMFAAPASELFAAAVIFNQDAANTTYLGTQSGTYDANAQTTSGRAVYDDFVLGSNASLTRVEWTGGIVPSGTYSGIADNGASAVTFAVSIFADNGNEPNNGGAPLATLLTPFTAVTGSALPAASSGDARGFRYAIDLGSSVNLSANTVYWLQITALFDASAFTNPGSTRWDWHWTAGTAANGALANGYYFDGTASQLFSTSSSAFTLIGDTGSRVPEPSSIALLGACVALVAGGRHRSRRIR